MPDLPENSILRAIGGFIRRISPPQVYQPEDGLAYWREQIFLRVLVVMVLGSTLVVGAIAAITIELRYWPVLIVDILAYIASLFAAFSRRIPLQGRIHIFMVIVFSLGLALQIIGGPIGNGDLILFIFPILAATLLGWRAATTSLFLNLAALVLLGFFLDTAPLQNSGMASYTLLEWIGFSLGFMVFNTLIAYSLSLLLEGLTDGFNRSQKYADALQESERRYRGIVEDQVELICRLLPDTTYTFVNHAYARLYGKEPEEVIGRKLRDILSASTAQRLEEAYQTLTPEHASVSAVYLEPAVGGEPRWFAWTDRGIFDDQGKLSEVQAVGQDIHERMLAQRALEESEARYRVIVEDQTELICRFSPDAVLSFVNEAYCRFFGKSVDELLHTTVLELLLEEARQPFLKAIASLTPEAPVVQLEMERKNGQGDIRWLNWTYHGIFENGRLEEVQAVGQDIHDRKMTEQALLESEARYRAIVEGQIEPVCRWYADYTLTFVNDAYCQLFKKKRRELLGQSLQQLVPEEDWPLVTETMEHLSEGGSRSITINRVITPLGLRWMQWSMSVIKDSTGEIIEFQSVGHDITEQKQTQQMLQESLSEQIKLTDANQELVERLEGLYLMDVNRHEAQLSHLAHELHDDVLNALAVVSANLDPEETAPHVIQAYAQAIQRTREIVNGLRTTMLNYGLYIGLETLADEFADQFPDGPIFYVDVPALDIRYDPNVELHLFRIVQEACNNAVKYAGATEIHMKGKLESDQAVLEVWDNGKGFAADEVLDLPVLLREKHFGLAGMLERAELIHAVLEIQSIPQQGTHVRVCWRTNEKST